MKDKDNVKGQECEEEEDLPNHTTKNEIQRSENGTEGLLYMLGALVYVGV
jgi:hypothetical protein